MIDGITFTHTITVEEYNELRASVEFITIRPNRAETALKNSLYTLIAMDGEKPAGMARVVGDGGYVYFICDVIVRPDHQSMGLGRQEYWSGLPLPSPGDLPDPGIKPVSPALQVDSLPLSHLGSPYF